MRDEKEPAPAPYVGAAPKFASVVKKTFCAGAAITAAAQNTRTMQTVFNKLNSLMLSLAATRTQIRLPQSAWVPGGRIFDGLVSHRAAWSLRMEKAERFFYP